MSNIPTPNVDIVVVKFFVGMLICGAYGILAYIMKGWVDMLKKLNDRVNRLEAEHCILHELERSTIGKKS